ncbi:phage tail protein [Acinetobacter baumannii]|uniref:phage tail fiber protein n=1 Tax=Acinetobacter baumannii TaxID=470 RepID=UPI002953CED5|nr:phage tail protein [Acinetobacter baumannii]MDV7999350.1 phage tail protein [Acinetobacter baumannii]MDV8097467.1 phage tail protein [Acinetobacter baumannii]
MANLVFKYSWDHRPFPYNSAQGKRQFMLPFASGIPNLTPDYTQVAGLGSAATYSVTGSREDTTGAGLIKVGDYGIGSQLVKETTTLASLNTPGASYITASGGITDLPANWGGGRNVLFSLGSTYQTQLLFDVGGSAKKFAFRCGPSGTFPTATWYEVRSTANTTVDANGFVKSASPIVKLFAESIELNDSAKKQPVEFEKINVGNYLLKGSLGFAQEGWYIEVPKDANGNTVVAVEYSTLENGDLSIKTYKRKFDFELAAVIADHENPMDIPEGRWIDIRLHEEPEPEPDEPLSETPVDFQPTNLSQAVAAAMNGVEPPEISDTNETL